MPQFVQWNAPYHQAGNQCVTIELSDLISNLESSLDRIFDACALVWSPIHRADLTAVTQQWLSLQQHLHKDLVVDAIVNGVVRSEHFDWSQHQLTMWDEAFVQWTLRDLHGLDMKCYNVNVFPTNTTDLRNLLINE